MRNLVHCLLATAAIVSCVSSPAVAAEPDSPPSPVADVVNQERLRSQVEEIFADLRGATDRHDDDEPLFDWISNRLIALGPEVAPLMAAELENRSLETFNIAAFVLGRVRAPGNAEALRKAIEDADRDGGMFGLDRKAWAAYGLALLGEVDAVDLLDSGKVNAVRKEFLIDMSALEVVSVLTAPKSTPRLLAKLDRYAKDETLRDRLYVVLRAIRRVADPSVRDRVLPYLKDDQPYVRDAAARALAAIGDPAIADRLIAALDDPALFSRFGVASAIGVLKPAGKTKALLARLEVETDGPVRGEIYRTLAASGPAMIETFAKLWGRPDPVDRAAIVDAVGVMKSQKGLNLLRTALQDEDLRVVLHAMASLADIGGPGANDTLVALLADPRPPVEELAIGLVVRQREPRAAARIADRLRKQLAEPVTDPGQHDMIRSRGNALVDLRDPSQLSFLREASTRQTDPTVVGILRQLTKTMGALAEMQGDSARWIEALAAADPDIRRLARERLAELKPPGGVKALVDAFGRSDVGEGVGILRSLASIASPESAELVERILLDPTFDAYERRNLRSMAAWVARRIGGDRMVDLLRRAAERREGRDCDVLVYLSILAGRNALPVLESYRWSRLRFFDWWFGPELARLEWMIAELEAGRSIGSLDRPPDEISVREGWAVGRPAGSASIPSPGIFVRAAATTGQPQATGAASVSTSTSARASRGAGANAPAS